MQRYETQRRKAYIVRLTIAQLMITFVGMLAAYLAADLEGVSSVFKGALAYVAVVLTHWLTPWLMPKNANA